MTQQWRYLIPSILSVFFIILSVYFHFAFIFLVLLAANVLNWKWGEFKEKELSETLRYFYTSQNAQVIKSINAILLIGLVLWGMVFVDRSGFRMGELIGFSVTVGILTGCFIVTLGHDLLHGRSVFQKILSTLLFTIAGIPHFATEHICGHHREVGLKEDPTTASVNESFYKYFIKITVSNFNNIWITQYGLPSYLRKRILMANTGMVLLLFTVYLMIYMFAAYPAQVSIFFMVQGLISYILYELINYIQHYGLLRKDRNAPITQDLAWNCYYKYTNYILFLLPLHSLHHLTHRENKIKELLNGPRMPYLYFLMILMALIPPLWFNKMNKLLKQYNPAIA